MLPNLQEGNAQNEVVEPVIAKPVVPKLTKGEFAEFRAALVARDAEQVEPTEEEVQTVESAWNATHPPLQEELSKKPKAAKELDPELAKEFANAGLKSAPLVQPSVFNFWSKTPKFTNELEPAMLDRQKKAAADLNRFANVVIPSPTAEQIAKDCLGDFSEQNQQVSIIHQLQNNHRNKFRQLYSTQTKQQIDADCGNLVSTFGVQMNLDTALKDKKKDTVKRTFG